LSAISITAIDADLPPAWKPAHSVASDDMFALLINAVAGMEIEGERASLRCLLTSICA
jgi:hypothetical protein